MGAEDSTLGLIFEIAADPSKAINATESFRDQASRAMRDFEEQMMSTMTKSLGITKEFAVGMAVGAGAVIGLGVAMFELADKAAEVGAKIFEVHEKTEMSAASLSGLMALTRQTGENFDSLSTALARAGVNLEKAIVTPGATSSKILADVMGGAKDLADLGLKPMDERLQEVLKHIFELHDVGERNLALQTLMGRGWQTNVESLKLLAEQGYGPAIEAAKRFGFFFDDEAAKKAKAFQAEWAQTKMTFESVAMTLGQNLIPMMSTLLENILVMAQYLPQVGKLLKDMSPLQVLLHGFAPATEDIANWKSLGQVMKDVEFQIQSLVLAGTKGSGVLPIIDHDAEQRAKNMAALLAKAAIERTRTWEAVDKKATEQLERRDDVEMKRIQARDAIIEKAQRDMAKTMEHIDEQTTKFSVEHNNAAWKKILDRDEIGNMARKQMAQTWENVNETTMKNSTRINNEMWKINTASALKYYETVASTALGTLSEIAGVVRGNHAIEVALIIARGAIKSAEQVAEGLAAAAYGNFWSAGMHYASAAAFAGLAGYSASVSSPSGGGSVGGGVSGSGSSGGGGGPVHLAPGASPRGMGGTVHVIVSSSDRDLANHIGSLLTTNVRHGGGQLVASKLNGT